MEAGELGLMGNVKTLRHKFFRYISEVGWVCMYNYIPT